MRRRSGEPPRLEVVVGDVAGKGLAAALVTAMARAALRYASAPASDGLLAGAADPPGTTATADATSAVPPATPAAIMRRVSEQLNRDLGRQNFVACAVALLETGDAGPQLRVGNGGQVPVLLCRDASVVELEPPGDRFPLGAIPAAAYEDVLTPLQPGDIVVFSSDGLPEAPRMSDGEFFGFERLAAAVAHWAGCAEDAEAVAAGIWSDLTAWCGEESHHDDMTLLVLRVPA